MPVSIENQTSAPASPTPSSGPGSQTPPNPNNETTPLGGVPSVKPNGTPGAPASGGAAPAPGLGAPKPGMNPPAGAAPAISPEDLNRYKAIQQSLYPDLMKAIDTVKSDSDDFDLDNASDEDVTKIKQYLLDIGWDSTYLSNEILKTNNIGDIKKFFSLVMDYQEKSNDSDLKQFENFVNQKSLNVDQQSTSLKMQEKMNDQSKLQVEPKPLAVQEKLNQTKNSSYSLRGTGMTGSIVVSNGEIKVASPAQETHEVVATLFKAIKAADRSIDNYRHATIFQKGAEALGESTDAFDVDHLRSEVEATVSTLSSKIAEAFNFQKGNEDPKIDKELTEFIGKGKDTVNKGKSLFEKKDEPKPEDKKEPFGEKKDEPKPAEGDKKPEGEKKDAPKPFEGEKKEEPKKDDAKSILAGIKEEFTKLKEAQLYPYKDINKQDTYKDINAKDAADAAKASTKALSDAKSDKTKGFLGVNREKSNLITPKQLEKVKSKVTANAFAKSKLAMELASQQQFKGLLPNPLKEAMVKNMVEAGFEKSAAEAIAHNSFLDGYQSSYEVVSKEAFANFVNKDHDEFVKIAKVTVESGMVEAASAVTTKEAAPADKTLTLRTASAETKKDEGFTEIIKAHLNR